MACNRYILSSFELAGEVATEVELPFQFERASVVPAYWTETKLSSFALFVSNDIKMIPLQQSVWNKKLYISTYFKHSQENY